MCNSTRTGLDEICYETGCYSTLTTHDKTGMGPCRDPHRTHQVASKSITGTITYKLGGRLLNSDQLSSDAPTGQGPVICKCSDEHPIHSSLDDH